MAGRQAGWVGGGGWGYVDDPPRECAGDTSSVSFITQGADGVMLTIRRASAREGRVRATACVSARWCACARDGIRSRGRGVQPPHTHRSRADKRHGISRKASFEDSVGDRAVGPGRRAAAVRAALRISTLRGGATPSSSSIKLV